MREVSGSRSAIRRLLDLQAALQQTLAVIKQAEQQHFLVTRGSHFQLPVRAIFCGDATQLGIQVYK